MNTNLELLEALKALLGPFDDPKLGWRSTQGTETIFACEFCGKRHEDCTLIVHLDDCPIPQARTAIAHAEQAERVEPVAVRHSFDGYGWMFTDNGDGSSWFENGMKMPDAELLYTTLPAAAVSEHWQPIETAPKDGTNILGMYMHIDTQIVHNIFWLDNEYEPEENGWWTYEYSEVSRMKLEDWMTPTHWMPLPPAPSGVNE